MTYTKLNGGQPRNASAPWYMTYVSNCLTNGVAKYCGQVFVSLYSDRQMQAKAAC